MTPEEFYELQQFRMYHEGFTDSGVYNPIREKFLVNKLMSLPGKDTELILSRYLRESYLSEEALALGYHLSDLLQFLNWLDEQHGICFK